MRLLFPVRLHNKESRELSCSQEERQRRQSKIPAPSFWATLFAAGFFSLSLWTAPASDQPEVQFTSACECQGNHGVYRWTVKTDHEAPPDQIADDHKIKPSDIAAWPEPRGVITTNTPRSGREKEWYQVTGKVVLMRAEADGDIHIQLVDADNPSGINVVVEVPVRQTPGLSPWCDIRKKIFADFSNTQPPFTLTSDLKLELKTELPLIRVEGKAFFDATHKGHGAPPNRRQGDTNVSIWEIHPVMVLDEVQPGQTGGQH